MVHRMFNVGRHKDGHITITNDDIWHIDRVYDGDTDRNYVDTTETMCVSQINLLQECSVFKYSFNGINQELQTIKTMSMSNL